MWWKKKQTNKPDLYPVLFTYEQKKAEDFAAWLEIKNIPNVIVENKRKHEWSVNTDSTHYQAARMCALTEITVQSKRIA